MVDSDAGLPAAWHALCTQLAALGDELAARDASTDDPAREFRHLSRQLVLALQSEIEHGDPTHPSFHRYEEPWTQWGGPNPDNVYTRAVIDPTSTYRVTGTLAGVRLALFSLLEGDMHLGQYGVFGEVASSDLTADADGTMELWISPEPHEGNWLASHPDARFLVIRQYQCDWEHDRIATFTIDRIDPPPDGPPTPTAADLTTALARAGTWIERSVEFWYEYVERARDALTHNAVAPPGTPKGGAPNIAYGAGWWDLDPDQILVIETDRPDADYWGWTIHHRFRLDSGDFANRQTSLNMTQAYADEDGRIRVAVAALDPGVPNWIDTEGQPEGMLVYRSIGTRSRPVPHSTVVRSAELRDHLPASHPVVDDETRAEQLRRRRDAVLARYT
ncbi:MAG: DUF1214 domain-containing protein [Acidimicrobiia bacterium]|nr:DUF1214 domain-containing protein [Acidimicrobiia bacterium]